MDNYYQSIEEIKRAAAQTTHSQYWFSPDTMRFFSSIVEPEVYGGHYFVTSEQPPFGPRAYTVRSCYDGEIRTVSEMLEYPTKEDAAAAAKFVAGVN